MLAREQHIQHDPERVDVCRRRHRRAGHLLGGGVFWRQDRTAFARQLRRRAAPLVLDQLRDAEVQQFHTPIPVDEDVRRLHVAMDNQIRVRVRDRVSTSRRSRFELGQGERVGRGGGGR